MQIKMITTHYGSEDGFAVKQYLKGELYSVADTLARYFMSNGWAYNCDPIEETFIVFEQDHGQATRTFRPQPMSPHHPKTLQELGEVI